MRVFVFRNDPELVSVARFQARDARTLTEPAPATTGFRRARFRFEAPDLPVFEPIRRRQAVRIDFAVQRRAPPPHFTRFERLPFRRPAFRFEFMHPTRYRRRRIGVRGVDLKLVLRTRFQASNSIRLRMPRFVATRRHVFRVRFATTHFAVLEVIFRRQPIWVHLAAQSRGRPSYSARSFSFCRRRRRFGRECFFDAGIFAFRVGRDDPVVVRCVRRQPFNAHVRARVFDPVSCVCLHRATFRAGCGPILEVVFCVQYVPRIHAPLEIGVSLVHRPRSARVTPRFSRVAKDPRRGRTRAIFGVWIAARHV